MDEIHFSDGKIETIELRGNTFERYENETVESILLLEFDESWRAIFYVYIVVCILRTKNGKRFRATRGVYGPNDDCIKNYATFTGIGR